MSVRSLHIGALAALCLLFGVTAPAVADDSKKVSEITIFAENLVVDYSNEKPDEYFVHDTDLYDEDLARLSCSLAINDSWLEDEIANIYSAIGFNKKGFYFNSSDKPDYFTRFFMGDRVVDMGGKKTLVVSVAVGNSISASGLYHHADFMMTEFGNTDLEADTVLSFDASKKIVYDELKKNYDFSAISKQYDNFVVWITGTIRGAAIGNLLAKQLVDEFELLDPGHGTQHVSAYLFAVMNVTKSALTKNSSQYGCIFNICNTDDVMPEIPLRSWGYGRWGVDVKLALPGSSGSTQRSDFRGRLSDKWVGFMSGTKARQSAHPNTEKYDYPADGDCNGVTIADLIAHCYEKVSSMSGLYNQQLTFKTGLLSSKKMSMAIYPFVKKTILTGQTGGFSLSELGDIILYSTSDEGDLKYFADWGVKYGMGAKTMAGVLTKINLMGGVQNISVVAGPYFTSLAPENYLTWTSVENPTEGISNYASLKHAPDIIYPPTVSGSYVFDNTPKSVQITADYQGYEMVSASSVTSATEIGSYTVTFALKDKANSVWTDNTTADKSITWKIEPLVKSFSVQSNTAKLTFNKTEAGMQVVVAGYDAGGRMLEMASGTVSGSECSVQLHKTAASYHAFVLDAEGVPLCDRQSL